MKIAFVTTGNIDSVATSKRAYGLCEPLTQMGHQVAIIAQESEANKTRMLSEAPSATPLWFAAVSSASEIRAKRNIIKRWQPDVVYVCAYGIRSLMLPFKDSVNATYLTEYSELLSAIKNQPVTRRVLARILESLSLRLFDGHILASKYLDNHYNNFLIRKSKRALYSPYAYSPDMIMPDGNALSKARRKYQDRKIIVYMGTLSRNYGILDLLDAMVKVRAREPNALLLVAGGGRDAEVAKVEIEQKGLNNAVELLGYVPDDELPVVLGLADVFVAPLYDSIQDKARCPSKLFFYLPFNRPVVTTRIGEAYELFGDYNFYYEIGDVGSLARSLIDALGVRSGWASSWDAKDHTWAARAVEFDSWLRKN